MRERLACTTYSSFPDEPTPLSRQSLRHFQTALHWRETFFLVPLVPAPPQWLSHPFIGDSQEAQAQIPVLYWAYLLLTLTGENVREFPVNPIDSDIIVERSYLELPWATSINMYQFSSFVTSKSIMMSISVECHPETAEGFPGSISRRGERVWGNICFRCFIYYVSWRFQRETEEARRIVTSLRKPTRATKPVAPAMVVQMRCIAGLSTEILSAFAEHGKG